MYLRYTVVGYTNDFGVMDDGKKWSGKRAVLQELRFDDENKTATQGLTVVCKCSKDFREVSLGVTGVALFDRSGKLSKIEYNASGK